MAYTVNVVQIMISNLTYGFILKEDLQYINIIELYQNVRYTDDESMFMVTWIGDTPPVLHGLLEIVVDTEEQVNKIMSGEWNVEQKITQLGI